MQPKVAVIGAGLIGRAWAIVFARGGIDVRLYDVEAEALDQAKIAIASSLKSLAEFGLVGETEPLLSRIQTTGELASALDGTGYVQECGPEAIETKREIFATLDAHTPPETILASSTSGIAASRYTDHLKHPERCLVAHPVNPPYLIPLVELVPAPATAPAVVDRAKALLEQVGQTPIVVRQEIAGFVLNRLQGALLNEALRLVAGNYISVEDLDKTVKNGLGLRWSFMGPLETADLNAPGGIADYAKRYGALYASVATEQAQPPDWSDGAIAELERQRRTRLRREDLPARQQWRDRRLMALIAHQRTVE
jgi:L-gulonate 3-dehydrogenase